MAKQSIKIQQEYQYQQEHSAYSKPRLLPILNPPKYRPQQAQLQREQPFCQNTHLPHTLTTHRYRVRLPHQIQKKKYHDLVSYLYRQLNVSIASNKSLENTTLVLGCQTIRWVRLTHPQFQKLYSVNEIYWPVCIMQQMLSNQMDIQLIWSSNIRDELNYATLITDFLRQSLQQQSKSMLQQQNEYVPLLYLFGTNIFYRKPIKLYTAREDIMCSIPKQLQLVNQKFMEVFNRYMKEVSRGNTDQKQKLNRRICKYDNQFGIILLVYSKSSQKSEKQAMLLMLNLSSGKNVQIQLNQQQRKKLIIPYNLPTLSSQQVIEYYKFKQQHKEQYFSNQRIQFILKHVVLRVFFNMKERQVEQHSSLQNDKCGKCKLKIINYKSFYCLLCNNHYHSNCSIQKCNICQKCSPCYICLTKLNANQVMFCKKCLNGYHLKCLTFVSSIDYKQYDLCFKCRKKTEIQDEKTEKKQLCAICKRGEGKKTNKTELWVLCLCSKWIHQKCDPCISELPKKIKQYKYYCPLCRVDIIRKYYDYIIDSLTLLDQFGFFQNPVYEDLHNYGRVVESPMDFKMMKNRNCEGCYDQKGLSQIEKDFDLLIRNAILYNMPNDIPNIQARKMKVMKPLIFNLYRQHLNLTHKNIISGELISLQKLHIKEEHVFYMISQKYLQIMLNKQNDKLRLHVKKMVHQQEKFLRCFSTKNIIQNLQKGCSMRLYLPKEKEKEKCAFLPKIKLTRFNGIIKTISVKQLLSTKCLNCPSPHGYSCRICLRLHCWKCRCQQNQIEQQEDNIALRIINAKKKILIALTEQAQIIQKKKTLLETIPFKFNDFNLLSSHSFQQISRYLKMREQISQATALKKRYFLQFDKDQYRKHRVNKPLLGFKYFIQKLQYRRFFQWYDLQSAIWRQIMQYKLWQNSESKGNVFNGIYMTNTIFDVCSQRSFVPTPVLNIPSIVHKVSKPLLLPLFRSLKYSYIQRLLKELPEGIYKKYIHFGFIIYLNYQYKNQWDWSIEYIDKRDRIKRVRFKRTFNKVMIGVLQPRNINQLLKSVDIPCREYSSIQQVLAVIQLRNLSQFKLFSLESVFNPHQEHLYHQITEVNSKNMNPFEKKAIFQNLKERQNIRKQIFFIKGKEKKGRKQFQERCTFKLDQIVKELHINLQSELRSRYSQQKVINNLQQLKGANIIVGPSIIHNIGLFALQNLQQNTFVIEYKGEIIREDISDAREEKYKAMGYNGCYMFTLAKMEEEIVIDATFKGNQARYVNHSCDVQFCNQPNCGAKKEVIGGRQRIILFTKRRVYSFEQLTYDYNFGAQSQKLQCCCKSKFCQGRLN